MNHRRILAAAAAVLVLGACGSSRSSSPSTAPTSASGSARTGAASQTRTRTSTVTVTETARAPATQCLASDLKLTALGQQGGMGHGEVGFSLRNTSSQPCRTGGYPGLLFLDSAGRSLPTRPTRVTHDFFGTAPVAPITLRPGQSASFRVGTTHEAAGKATCTTAAAVQVIAPNDTATMRTTVPDGVYECQVATVSPLRPGATAYP